MAHDKPLYEMALLNTIRGLKVLNISGYDKNIWDPLLEAYPASTKINPVLVTTDPFPDLSDRGDNFLYFKQKGPRKVYYIRHEGGMLRNVELENLFSGSIKTLDDSRKFVRYKKRGGR
jgi:hypothetical protein